MAKPINTCSIEGVLTDPVRIADYIMAIYFATHPKHSTLHSKEDRGMGIPFKEYSTKPDLLVQKIKEDLIYLLGKNLDDVEITVVRQEVSDRAGGVLVISGSYSSDGQTYDLKESSQGIESYMYRLKG